MTRMPRHGNNGHSRLLDMNNGRSQLLNMPGTNLPWPGNFGIDRVHFCTCYYRKKHEDNISVSRL